MRLAAAGYPLEPFDRTADPSAKTAARSGEAARGGADPLPFPDYAAMALAHLAGPAAADLARAAGSVSERLAARDATVAALGSG